MCRQNTSLICVATVKNVLEGRILVHFDGWEVDYDYWVKPDSIFIQVRRRVFDHLMIIYYMAGFF